ncbi:hypothetical protein emb_1c0409 [Coriobacteriaceae bacterium EMTCatB1]|nr:hypothetical protein emb_1c0409 [Coriobacteriaceae bacterium EMTCatB1]
MFGKDPGRRCRTEQKKAVDVSEPGAPTAESQGLRADRVSWETAAPPASERGRAQPWASARATVARDVGKGGRIRTTGPVTRRCERAGRSLFTPDDGRRKEVALAR